MSHSQDCRGCGREESSRAVNHARARTFELHSWGGSAQLADSFDQREQAAATGVVRGKSAAVSIDRQSSTGRDPSVFNERARFSGPAKADAFERGEDGVRERVVKLC